jgi:hypothetical protein
MAREDSPGRRRRAGLATPRPAVFVTHVPLRDPDGVRNGGLSSTAEGDQILDRLARAGVAAILHGHIHDLVELRAAGIPTWISGGGARSNARLDDVGRHVLIVEIDPATAAMSVARRDLGLP